MARREAALAVSDGSSFDAERRILALEADLLIAQQGQRQAELATRDAEFRDLRRHAESQTLQIELTKSDASLIRTEDALRTALLSASSHETALSRVMEAMAMSRSQQRAAMQTTRASFTLSHAKTIRELSSVYDRTIESMGGSMRAGVDSARHQVATARTEANNAHAMAQEALQQASERVEACYASSVTAATSAADGLVTLAAASTLNDTADALSTTEGLRASAVGSQMAELHEQELVAALAEAKRMHTAELVALETSSADALHEAEARLAAVSKAHALEVRQCVRTFVSLL